MLFNRDDLLARLIENDAAWDVLVIGGGATGLGTALDAAARGFRTLLLEQHDFAKGTSSRSTKLVHGGVRYLAQGNVGLVREALRERERLRHNVPHLVERRPFVIPSYRWWERPYYGLGLKVYQLLAGRRRFGTSRQLSPAETRARLPTIRPDGLRGGVLYFDGQFDDARLAVNMAQTVAEVGGIPLNYMRVVDLLKTEGRVSGVVARDEEAGTRHEITARAVVNATGVFADEVRRMDDLQVASMIQPSRGIHIVLERSFLPGNNALMIPRTDDGRVLFAIPWHDRVVVGTTDTPVDRPSLEPRPSREEQAFLLEHAARYLTHAPSPQDVLSTFAGLRPLVSSASDDTASISRDHTLQVSDSGLVTITGGKWTTYRLMAEDAVDRALAVAGLEVPPAATKTLSLHGAHPHPETLGAFRRYGADAPQLRAFLDDHPDLDAALHPDLPARKGEVIWAARHEMARTVEDVLARRTRCLFLDARASIEAAPAVARLLAGELGREEAWIRTQIDSFRNLAQHYLPR